MPAELAPNSLLAIWISLKIPNDAAAGTRRDVARLGYAGGSRGIALETEILPPVLRDDQAIGFYPMGFDKSSLKMYFDWDEETYYRKLPGILRQAGEFGVNAYSLDAKGIRVQADAGGNVSIDAGGLKRELDAVRSAACVDLLEIGSFHHIANGAEFAKIVRARNLADDFEAWEYVIPEVRKTLRELGVEDRLVCRHADEIADYEGWLGYARIYRRCGVRMTVAINGYGVFNRRLGVGTMGLWMPLYNFYLNRWGKPIPDDDAQCFSRVFREQRHAAGEAIWPYVCGPGPYAWSTRERSQARFLIVDTFMKGADGLTYYGGAVWSHSLDPAFRDTVKADLLDTDATFVTLFYPDAARGLPLPSVRAGAFRIGLEDAGATRALRDLARAKGRLPEIEAAVEKAYAKLTAGSSQQAFDEYRQTLGRLYRGLED